MAEEINEPNFDAPIPGMSLTHELGARPWQSPPQYTTVEEVLDYYIPKFANEEVTEQVLDVLEMGVPVSTLANIMQTSGVMEGKHSIDVGMLATPVLMELIMYIADTEGIEYNTGMEKDKKVRSSFVDAAIDRLATAKETEEDEFKSAKGDPEAQQVLTELTIGKETGLMGRRD